MLNCFHLRSQCVVVRLNFQSVVVCILKDLYITMHIPGSELVSKIVLTCSCLRYLRSLFVIKSHASRPSHKITFTVQQNVWLFTSFNGK